MSELWDWETAWEALPILLSAFFKVTLVITVASTAIAATLGLVIAVVRRSLPRPLSAVVKFFVDFIRMTPLVVQLLFVWYAFTGVSSLMIAIVVFGIHYSTYMAEVYRAGIDSVPKGQWEATTALSMSRGRTWIAVIIPQALRATIPALGNYAVSMFKDTPFVIAIGVVDMVQASLNYGGNNFTYIVPLTLAGIIFLVASYPTSLLVGRLEKRLVYNN